MSSDSTRKRCRRKTLTPPAKPYTGFPLTPHSSGKWQKKILGRTRYFGNWCRVEGGDRVRVPDDGWKDALAEYDRQKEDLHAGREPGEKPAGEASLAGICNAFLNAKRRRMQSSELSVRSFQEYKQTTDLLISHFGKNHRVSTLSAADFERLREEIAKRCGPVRLGNEVVRVRSVFKYAAKNRLIEHPVEFGSEFTRPSKSILRRHKAASDKKLFDPAEIRLILDATLGREVVTMGKHPRPVTLKADMQMHAAIWLAINCACGNTDLSDMQLKHVDLKKRWLDYPRGKTGISRRIPLWKETANAVGATIDARPEPKTEVDAGCVFLTHNGTRLVRVGETSRTDYIGRQFNKLLHALGINGRRGLGLYSLRHTFATIGLQTGDRDVVRVLMGHVESDVLAQYDETGPSDQRRIAVVTHVHHWLFNGAEK